VGPDPHSTARCRTTTRSINHEIDKKGVGAQRRGLLRAVLHVQMAQIWTDKTVSASTTPRGASRDPCRSTTRLIPAVQDRDPGSRQGKVDKIEDQWETA